MPITSDAEPAGATSRREVAGRSSAYQRVCGGSESRVAPVQRAGGTSPG